MIRCQTKRHQAPTSSPSTYRAKQHTACQKARTSAGNKRREDEGVAAMVVTAVAGGLIGPEGVISAAVVSASRGDGLI